MELLLQKTIINFLKTRSEKKVKDIFWKQFYHAGLRCNTTNCGSLLNILILNVPCHGFGDIIFSIKLSTYLCQWYGASICIATTVPKDFISLGWKKDNLLMLQTKTKNRYHCRRFRFLSLATLEGKKIKSLSADLYFVAPLQTSFYPDLADVHHLFPDSNRFNTRFFSEYNSESPNEYDFPTGVGRGYLGLFLTDKSNFDDKPPENLSVPYAVAYIAQLDFKQRTEMCLLAFLELISHKYHFLEFDIVVPSWIIKDLEKISKKLLSVIDPYYTTVRAVLQNEEIVFLQKNGNLLTLRADILPVSNTEMTRLMKYSVDDILVTGDQSISDALSCCTEKNIFYQVAPWKESFARQLAKNLPNRFLSRKKTSCGTLDALSYRSDYKNFFHNWDFRQNGKKILDAMILQASSVKTDKNMRALYNLVKNVPKLNNIKKKIRAEYY
jgi:hypothetical protein